MQPELEELAAEGSAVLLAGLRSEDWKRVRNRFAEWLNVLGQSFYARDLADLKGRQDGYTQGSLAGRRWHRRLSEALEEAQASSLAEEGLRSLIKEFSPPGQPTRSDTSDTISPSVDTDHLTTGSLGHVPVRQPETANDHVDFRQGTFHAQVVGVQHNYGSRQPGGVLPNPDDWPLIADVDPITLGVRAGRLSEEKPGLAPYVVRDADSAVGPLFGESSLVVITGGHLSGKTRTAWDHLDDRFEDGTRVLPGTTRIYAPAPGTDLRGLPGLLRGRDGWYVLWLDELEGHLGQHGLDVALLSQLSALRVQVLATMRDELYDDHRFGGGPASRVLSQAVTVELGSRWSAAELARLARASADDPRLADALKWRGDRSVPEYLAVGPELRALWRRAARPGSPHARGHLLVRAAIDLARCGVTGDIPVTMLEKACVAYGDDATAEAERESLEKAFEWATERRHGVTGLLVCGSKEGTWRAYGSLVADALRASRLSEISAAVWRCALEGTDYDADVHRSVRTTAHAAFIQKAEDGDLEAMHMMGLLGEDAEDEATALEWFRRAADAGKAELSGRVGELLLRRGRVEESLPYLRTAAEGDPAGHVVRLLGQAHLTLAEHWLREAAGRGDDEAAHQLGDVLLGRGDTETAGRHYLMAEGGGYAPVARSTGLLALLEGAHETAEVYLRRAAAAGDDVAADLLRFAHPGPEALDVAEEGFQDPMDVGTYPLDAAHHGAVLEKKGLLDEARAQYEKAWERGDAYGAFRLAALLHGQGAAEEAAAWYHKAADTGHPAARKALTERADTVKE